MGTLIISHILSLLILYQFHLKTYTMNILKKNQVLFLNYLMAMN